MSRRCGSSKPTPTPLTVWLDGARNTRRKAVEGNEDPTTRQKPPIKELPRTAGVSRGGRKGSRTCRIPLEWRGGAGKALRQTNHRKGTMARRAQVDMEGNTGAKSRETMGYGGLEKPARALPRTRYTWSALWTTRDRLNFLFPRRATRLRREPHEALGACTFTSPARSLSSQTDPDGLFYQSPGWLLRSEARAFDLFPDYDYPEYKMPTLSYETHPNNPNTDNYRPVETVS